MSQRRNLRGRNQRKQPHKGVGKSFRDLVIGLNYTLQFFVQEVSQRRCETCCKIVDAVEAVKAARTGCYTVQHSSYSLQR